MNEKKNERKKVSIYTYWVADLWMFHFVEWLKVCFWEEEKILQVQVDFVVKCGKCGNISFFAVYFTSEKKTNEGKEKKVKKFILLSLFFSYALGRISWMIDCMKQIENVFRGKF